MDILSLQSLEDVAQALVAPGKGILAADESHGTIANRFSNIGVDATEENRRDYRELLFTAGGCEQHISGVILFDETLRQKTVEQISFPKVLLSKTIIPGIKVDKGAKSLAGSEGEKITEGLDGLRERLEEYRSLGARFAKWRAVLSISDTFPSDYCIDVNAHALARYAALCVEQDLVPIVEPEVLMDGAHSIEDCALATKRTLGQVFLALERHRVPITQILLKPNMVISGSNCTEQASPEEVAQRTIACFEEVLPDELPGIVFLSGGQSESEATSNLNAMNSLSRKPPWPLSFSYGRALQASALRSWQGQRENADTAQESFLIRARLNGLATCGQYTSDMELNA